MPAHKDILDRVMRELPSAPQVLEAGGGKQSRFPVPGAYITLIDIDEGVLVRSKEKGTAQEYILGDLEAYDYGERQFDLIVCWDVLEHVKHPALALQRLVAALSPCGLIVIKGPVSTSMKALVTRLTPHFVHVAFYRYVLGHAKAGQPTYAPFRTEFGSGADDTELAALLTNVGLKMIVWERYQSEHVKSIRAKSLLLYSAYLLAAHGLGAATLGRYGGLATDFWMLARR